MLQDTPVTPTKDIESNKLMSFASIVAAVVSNLDMVEAGEFATRSMIIQ